MAIGKNVFSFYIKSYKLFAIEIALSSEKLGPGVLNKVYIEILIDDISQYSIMSF